MLSNKETVFAILATAALFGMLIAFAIQRLAGG